MSPEPMLLASVALRLRISEKGHAVWMILVPGGSEQAVAMGLVEQITEQGGSACLWNGREPCTEAIALLVLADDAIPEWAARLDDERNRLVDEHTVALVIAEPRASELLHRAPHVASFIGKRVISTSVEDDDAPPEHVERRLQSLRDAYGMTDEQARQAFESGEGSGDPHLLEWMILLGTDTEGARGEDP